MGKEVHKRSLVIDSVDEISIHKCLLSSIVLVNFFRSLAEILSKNFEGKIYDLNLQIVCNFFPFIRPPSFIFPVIGVSIAWCFHCVSFSSFWYSSVANIGPTYCVRATHRIDKRIQVCLFRLLMPEVALSLCAPTGCERVNKFGRNQLRLSTVILIYTYSQSLLV